MKILNLTIAIIYTLLLGALGLSALLNGEFELLVGSIFLCPPVIANWMTYKNL